MECPENVIVGVMFLDAFHENYSWSYNITIL
jgi:hypothetical protein